MVYIIDISVEEVDRLCDGVPEAEHEAARPGQVPGLGLGQLLGLTVPGPEVVILVLPPVLVRAVVLLLPHILLVTRPQRSPPPSEVPVSVSVPIASISVISPVIVVILLVVAAPVVTRVGRLVQAVERNQEVEGKRDRRDDEDDCDDDGPEVDGDGGVRDLEELGGGPGGNQSR